MSLGFPPGRGVQTPEGGETAATFAEGPRQGLAPPPDAAFSASRNLKPSQRANHDKKVDKVTKNK